jgi:hypothetical protein
VELLVANYSRIAQLQEGFMEPASLPPKLPPYVLSILRINLLEIFFSYSEYKRKFNRTFLSRC